MFGRIQRTNGKSDNYIIKTDLKGKFQWVKYYGASNYHEDFGDVTDNNDGTFTISSNRYSDEYNIEPFGSQGFMKPWIFTVDTSGALITQWFGEWNDLNKKYGGGPFYHMRNGDWIIISREYKETFQNGSHFTASAPTITKLNSEHELDWKLYMAEYTGFWDNLLDLEYDSVRNEFVAAGQRVVYYTEQYSELEAWAVKFTPQGEVLWSLSDTIWSGSINGVVHFTAGVDISPSGSIYMAGTIEHKHSPTREFGWILKMNPDGCFESLCTTSSNEIIDQNEEYNIYPNPAYDYFILESPPGLKHAKLILSDVSGRCIRSFDILSEKQMIDNDVMPGIYFYSVYEKNMLMKSGKLAVEGR